MHIIFSQTDMFNVHLIFHLKYSMSDYAFDLEYWSMVVVFFSMSPLMCTIHLKYGSFGILFKWNETYQSQSRMLCRCCCYCCCCWWHEIKITKSCISIAIIRHWFPNNQTKLSRQPKGKNYHPMHNYSRCDMVKMYMQSFKYRVWMVFFSSHLVNFTVECCELLFISWLAMRFFPMEFKYCKMSLSSINIISMLGAFHMAGCETTNAMS